MKLATKAQRHEGYNKKIPLCLCGFVAGLVKMGSGELRALTEIRDIPLDKLQEKLRESKIEGGDLMPSLAQRLREEGRAEGERIGVKKGVKEGLQKGMQKGLQKGMQEGIKETAGRMLERGFDLDTISDITGLDKKEIKKMASTSH